ncbi:MAG: hypothetical protein IPH00_16775 [Flavobacteriales bacterium]|nr:hypothetical protein [Flavobacteriales bacterium]
MDSVKAGMVQMDDSTLTDAQRSAILSGLSGYRSNIGTLTAWNNSALQLAGTAKVLTADGIKAANTNVGTTKLIESNEKQVNEIYLSTVGKDVDTFTVDQTNTLFYIANQCPMVGGNAVYRARSLYRLIDDEQQFDDPQLCLQHGIIVKRLVPAQEADTIGVVPNPARDGATLVLGEPLEAGVFILFNSVGVEVMRLHVPTEEPRCPFSTSRLATGVPLPRACPIGFGRERQDCLLSDEARTAEQRRRTQHPVCTCGVVHDAWCGKPAPCTCPTRNQ